MPFTSAVIVAAGSSSRMGKDKLFLITDGMPVIAKTLLAFEQANSVNEIIIVTKESSFERMQKVAEEYNISKLKTVVKGGNCRQESVSFGFEAVSKESRYVCVHDGARPYVTPEDIDNVNEVAYSYGAAVCGRRSVDTVKVLDRDGFIEKTLDRNCVISVYTPQSFSNSVYSRALNFAHGRLEEYTDDSGLVEDCGVRVRFVECGNNNIKITYPEDLK